MEGGLGGGPQLLPSLRMETQGLPSLSGCPGNQAFVKPTYGDGAVRQKKLPLFRKVQKGSHTYSVQTSSLPCPFRLLGSIRKVSLPVQGHRARKRKELKIQIGFTVPLNS